jgi:hypothetical protein
MDIRRGEENTGHLVDSKRRRDREWQLKNFVVVWSSSSCDGAGGQQAGTRLSGFGDRSRICDRNSVFPVDGDGQDGIRERVNA